MYNFQMCIQNNVDFYSLKEQKHTSQYVLEYDQASVEILHNAELQN